MSTLVAQGLTDIDLLALAVRDPESKRLFDTTRNLLAASHPHWQAFVDARIADSRDATDHYAYPKLHQRLAVNGS